VVRIITLISLVIPSLASGQSIIADRGPEEPVLREAAVMLRYADGAPWLFYTLIGCFIIVVYTSFYYQKDLRELFLGFRNINLAYQLEREQELTLGLPAILLSVNFYLVFAQYLYIVAIYFGLGGSFSDLNLLLLLGGGIMSIYLVRYISMKVVGRVFPFRAEINSYNFTIFLFNKVLGLVFLPILLILALAPLAIANALVIPSLIIYILVILARSVRGFTIGSAFISSRTFHFLLYLCTLELFPAVAVYRLLDYWDLI
jgi:hypothetical protein